MAQAIPQHFRKPWKVLVSVCLTRMNVISKELNEIERRYAAYQEEVEHRTSIYNDYEHKKNTLLEKSKSKNSNSVGHEEEAETVQAMRELASIQDQEDVWAADFKKVTVAPGKTIADELTDRTTLNRQLDQVLHLVVKDNELLNTEVSLYPYTNLKEEETLRTASERLLQSHGITSKLLFLSNAPVGVLKIRFKEDEERGSLYQGAKVFFTKAQLQSPIPSNHTASDSKASYEWLTLSELEKKSNADYFRRVETFVA